MKKIYILGFGCGNPQDITLRTIKLLKESNKVYVRTTRHPSANILEEFNIEYTSFDEKYEKSENFDLLYQEIADTVLGDESEVISYIVPGSAVFAERAVQLILKDTTKEVEIVPAISFLDGIFASLKTDALTSFKLVDALSLDEQKIDTTTTNIICQVYDNEVASDVKLKLMEYFSDETPITMISAAATDEERIDEIELYELDRYEHIDHLTSIVIPPVPLKHRYASFDSICEVVDTLRSEHGCSWDKAQTHKSLIPHMIEETYEIIDAINEDDTYAMCEEIGDMLFHVLLQAKIAEDDFEFNIKDVIHSICKKMVHRHPFVFTDEKHYDGNFSDIKWEELKKEEKEFQTATDSIKAVAKSLPPLIYADKVQARAAKANFDYDNAYDAFEKIYEETQELLEALNSGDKEKILDEGGDLIFSVVNVLRLSKVRSFEALSYSSKKFIDRFETMENKIISEKKNIYKMKLAEIDQYWKK